MSQTYLTPSCSLSLCNIRSEILVALYPQMSQSSLSFAFISLELTIQLWFLELHDSPLELKGELQYLDENCHFRGEKMTILV